MKFVFVIRKFDEEFKKRKETNFYVSFIEFKVDIIAQFLSIGYLRFVEMFLMLFNHPYHVICSILIYLLP